ncbi:hypothetical protein ACJZ2D_007468 [Fusarium nematophilum]
MTIESLPRRKDQSQFFSTSARDERVRPGAVEENDPLSPNTAGAGHRAKPSPALAWLRSVKTKMALFYALGVGFIVGHFFFFRELDGQAVSLSRVNQSWQTTIANLFALMAELCLLSGMGLAYDQFIWRLLHKKHPSAVTTDKLVTLMASPWNILRPSVLRRAPFAALVAFLCFGTQIAATFPPGALDVEYKDAVVPVSVKNVPTMNISDYGDGTHRQFVDRCFYDMNGDLSFMNQFNPDLTSLANAVLSLGQPLQIPSPCSGPCSYNMSMDGPRFHCKELGAGSSLLRGTGSIFDPVYEAKDQARDVNSVAYFKEKNSFKMSWNPSQLPRIRNYNATKTLDCSITLARYILSIENSRNQSQTIRAFIESDNPIWTDDDWVQTQFHAYFISSQTGKAFSRPKNIEDLRTNFTRAQAYSISRAAGNAVAGNVDYLTDGSEEAGILTPWFDGNATGIIGSPYFGMTDRYNGSFNISAESIERYLQDVVISTISLRSSPHPMWTHRGEIQALEGANIYMFKKKEHFYGPYGACLATALFMYALGLWSLHVNGGPAGNNFLQSVETTSSRK